MNLHQIIAITMFAVIGIKGVRVLSTLYAIELGASPFGLGLGLGLGQPLTLVITSNLSPPGRFGEALGMRLTVNNLTHVVMPMVFGMLGSALGLAWVFWISAAFVALGGYFSRKKAEEPVTK